MSYLYEVHLHTTAASACAKSAGSEYISFYKNLGYDGIIVTDHFFNGNCCVPKNLPWEERVDIFCSETDRDSKCFSRGNAGLTATNIWSTDLTKSGSKTTLTCWDGIISPTTSGLGQTAGSSCRRTRSASGAICPRSTSTLTSATPLRWQTPEIRMNRTAWRTATPWNTTSP